MWVSKADITTSKEAENANVSSVLNQQKTGLDTNFSEAGLAFGYVAGLNTNYAATTPISFTRGIVSSSNGKWSETDGTYGTDGGHIVFIGGNVTLYKNLGASVTSGDLVNSNGTQTNDIKRTIKSTKTSVRFLEETAAGTSAGAQSPAGS
jgi:hypothetical protein